MDSRSSSILEDISGNGALSVESVELAAHEVAKSPNGSLAEASYIGEVVRT
ncbi:Hypothetical protein FKW44_017730, partial [Caligus rogercresseyi]